ncbi:hypothetical protein HWV62_8186 [Athelia sp. TMB]|nr:hypothetical protein HWV62_8186 [Athelia sp. TMB]
MHRLTSQKTSSGPPAKPSAKESPSLAKSKAFAGVQGALAIFKEVAGKTGVPGLQEGVSGLIAVLAAVKNTDDVQALTKRIQDLAEMLKKATDDDKPVSKEMQERIDRLAQAWVKSGERVHEIGSKPYMKRLVTREIDAQAITGEVAKITSAIDSFMVETMLAIEFALDGTRTLIQTSSERVESKIDAAYQGIKDIMIRQDLYAGVVPHVPAAQYDADEKLMPCHDGTRADVLSTVFAWADYGDAASADELPTTSKLQTARVFWINGPGSAGTGKTTIAYTVAVHLAAQHTLGASFFCSRDDSSRRDPKMVILTIVHQLGCFCSDFKELVVSILKEDPSIVHAVVPRQVEILLVKPLLKLGSKMPFCVVVIDALDECRDGGATSTVLSALAAFITSLAPLKFLITSRPEARILESFRITRLDAVTQRYILHQIEPRVALADVQVYLNSNLQRIKAAFKIDDWSYLDDSEVLTDSSAGLFIFAATAIRHIEDPAHGDPKSQLSALKKVISSDVGSYSHLDQLYLQVLEDAFPVMSAELLGKLKMILGSIAVLNQPLSKASLSQLLSLPSGAFEAIASRLHSVIAIPDDDQEPIRLIHPSFYEFITDRSRCVPKFLWFEEAEKEFI